MIFPGTKPIFYINHPIDYWHAQGRLPIHLEEFYELQVFNRQEELRRSIERKTVGNRVAVIGPTTSTNELGGDTNPESMTNHLHFSRAIKTRYEIDLMRLASQVGAKGHLAAKSAFDEGRSEFGIHMAYLEASNQNESGLPYPNIIGINENAGILHYQHQERGVPDVVHSLLIDAGGVYQGYASDITRSYARDQQRSFYSELIDSMKDHQTKLIDSIKIGGDFLNLHRQMHMQLTIMLVESGLVNCSIDEATASNFSEYFCPHGLGHLLGIQVHDVGGLQVDAEGKLELPPENYSSLRFTRPIAEDQIFTIEPGLYFIPLLLHQLKTKSSPVNWRLIEELLPYGGIRIEDNVRVLSQGTENLTRDAFADIQSKNSN